MKLNIVKSLLFLSTISCSLNGFAIGNIYNVLNAGFIIESSITGYGTNKVINGRDDRKEIAQYNSPTFRRYAKSVAVQVHKYDLEEYSASSYTFDTGYTLKEAMNTCPSERFSNQPVIGNCTGFLIAPDILLTAGHCFAQGQFDCDSMSWVFDYVKGRNVIAKRDVYNCKELMVQNTSGIFRTNDYAIVKLDRRVSGRGFLKLRTSGQAKKNDPVVVIGHPMGLPMKIAGNASIRSKRSRYFFTDLDTYGGNSGSPVFNAITGLVEGILISGEEDFINAGQCFVSSEHGKGKEKVFNIRKIKEIKFKN
jgi:hypothetical protein